MADRGNRKTVGRLWRTVAAMLAVGVLAAGCGGGASVTEMATGPTSSAPPADVDPGTASFAFEPFFGAPSNATDELLRKIATVADREGLNLVRRVGAPATFHVKGYLTAVGNPTATTLSYIYDIYDASGRRLHRIVGQEPSSGTSGDPWSGISAETLEVVADRTVSALKAWLASGGA
jgi:hypothetical protein